MTTWSHTCNVNGKIITMSSEEKSCTLCKTTYSDQVVKLSGLMPELSTQQEKQIPMLFKAFKKNE